MLSVAWVWGSKKRIDLTYWLYFCLFFWEKWIPNHLILKSIIYKLNKKVQINKKERNLKQIVCEKGAPFQEISVFSTLIVQ